MASSIPSAASKSCSSTGPSVSPCKYDVFLSFRGDDTRKGVVSHLYNELQNRSGIKTFMDEIRLEVGDPISLSLKKAIEESRFAVVVLSNNYASSEWCLDELTHIFQWMKGEDRILPLFYNVDPSHVRNQRGSFEAAFAKHEKKYKKSTENGEKVKKWRAALNSVGNLSGWNAEKFSSDRELVNRIVEDVRNKVHQILPPFEPSVTRRLPDETSEEVEKNHISVKPYGSEKDCNRFDDGVHSTVRQLVIHHYPKKYFAKVMAIQTEYVSEDGNSFGSKRHGRAISGVEKEKVVLDYPEEFLTSIHGRYDKHCGTTTIRSLTFKSNRRSYGPFGGVELDYENNFSIGKPGYKIVGLHGKSVDRRVSWPDPGLRAIGAHLKPI